MLPGGAWYLHQVPPEGTMSARHRGGGGSRGSGRGASGRKAYHAPGAHGKGAYHAPSMRDPAQFPPLPSASGEPSTAAQSASPWGGAYHSPQGSGAYQADWKREAELNPWHQPASGPIPGPASTLLRQLFVDTEHLNFTPFDMLI